MPTFANNLLLVDTPGGSVTDYSPDTNFIGYSVRDREFILSITKKLINANKEEFDKTNNKPRKEIFLKGDSSYFRLDFERILYFEAFGNYLKVHYSDDTWAIANCSIKSIEEELPQNVFCRVHRSFIVKMHRIDNFTSQNLQIQKNIIPIGRNFKASFEHKMVKL